MDPFSSPVENVLSWPEGTGDTPPLQSGWDALRALIEDHCSAAAGKNKPVCVGMDGYLNTDWEQVIREIDKLSLPNQLRLRKLDMRTCQASKSAQERLIAASLPPGEPVFGKIFKGSFASFFDKKKLEQAGRSMKDGSPTDVYICYGSGALLPPLKSRYALTFYCDITREEVLKRNRAWLEKKSKTQSVSPRQIYYVDFPIHDKHRKKTLPSVDYYVDANSTEAPNIIAGKNLDTIIGLLMTMPLRIKPLYEPGVWGGHWLKRNRKLPKTMVNCAYGFEIIAPEQSLIVSMDGSTFELPFNLLMERRGGMLMGGKAYKRYGDEFPVRVAYDDTWEGGNLSIQAHPTSRYMRETFNENLHQAEMYYIFDAKPGSIVHLGLRDGVDKEAFLQAARESEEKRKPFDHTEFVNVIEVEKGEIYLIPPGTVHGAGANELVLEISSTPYRYTFKIYDYLRPDLDGSFRPIHIEHAFNNIKFFRTASWVKENLVPKPILLKMEKQGNKRWNEYSIADRKEFYHAVHRIEFNHSYGDDTEGKFHLLNLVEGDIVQVRSKRGNALEHQLALSETLLLPAAVGSYEVNNLTENPCKVVKTLLRD